MKLIDKLDTSTHNLERLCFIRIGPHVICGLYTNTIKQDPYLFKLQLGVIRALILL